MTDERTVLIIARNGLSTAVSLLDQKVARLQKQAERATDPAAQKKLTARAKRAAKLSRALRAADAGATQYLADLEE